MTDLPAGKPRPDPEEALALLAESLDMTTEDLREQFKQSGFNERLEHLSQRVTEDVEERALEKIAASFGATVPERVAEVAPQDVVPATWYGRVIDGRTEGLTNFYYYKDDTAGANYPTGCYVDEVPPSGFPSGQTVPNYPTRTRTAGGTYIPTVLAAPYIPWSPYRPFCPLPEDYVVPVPGSHTPRRTADHPTLRAANTLCTIVGQRIYYIEVPNVTVWVKAQTISAATTTSFGPTAQTYFLCTGCYAVYDYSAGAFVDVGVANQVNIITARARAFGGANAGYYSTIAANQYLLCHRLTRPSRAFGETVAPVFPPLVLQKKTEPGADTSEVHVDEAGYTNEGKLWSYDLDT